MTDHLPECGYRVDHPTLSKDRQMICICEELRACEQRVREDERPYAKQTSTAIMAYDEGRRDGYAAGVQAARDAVAKLPVNGYHPIEVHNTVIDALAAIDALRQERSGNPDTSPSAENPDNRLSHDPTLHAWLNDADAPGPTGPDDTSYDVALSELEDLVARVREDERSMHADDLREYGARGERNGYAAALRDAVEAVKLSCSADMSLVERSEVIAAIESLGGER